ncbi:MAG TPA: hypothetical protein VGL66_00115 [Caulobacteraceae bacterium]
MRAWEVDWAAALAVGQSAVLIVAIVGLAVVLVRTRAAGRLAVRAIAASRQAARAAERRADAADAALDEMRRPWIVADTLRPALPEVWIEGRFDAQVELVLRNTGLAPARNVTVRLEPATLRRDELDALSRARVMLFDAGLVSGEEAAPAGAFAVVTPGQDLVFATRLTSPDITLPKVASGGLSVLGRIDYDDARGVRHSVRFAFDLARGDGVWRFVRRREIGETD